MPWIFKLQKPGKLHCLAKTFSPLKFVIGTKSATSAFKPLQLANVEIERLVFHAFYFMNSFKDVFFVNKNCWNSDQEHETLTRSCCILRQKSRRVINPTKACMSRTVQVYRRTNKWNPSQPLTGEKENLTLNSRGITSLAIQEFLFIYRQKENQTFHSGRCHVVAIYEFPETRQPLPRSSRCSFIPLIHQPAYFIPLQGLKLYRKREGFKLYVPHFDSYVLVLLPNT